MKFCEEKEIYYDVFGNTSIKIFWTKGIAEAKTEKNLELFQETIKNNFDLINSTLKKIDCTSLNQSILVLDKVRMNFFNTKVILKFNVPFLNSHVLMKIIELILKIDISKDSDTIADVLLNDGKENYIYKMLSESKPDDYYSNVFGGYWKEV